MFIHTENGVFINTMTEDLLRYGVISNCRTAIFKHWHRISVSLGSGGAFVEWSAIILGLQVRCLKRRKGPCPLCGDTWPPVSKAHYTGPGWFGSAGVLSWYKAVFLTHWHIQTGDSATLSRSLLEIVALSLSHLMDVMWFSDLKTWGSSRQREPF